MERFGLSEKQAQAILDMRLHRLTGLEREKIESEYKELQQLSSPAFLAFRGTDWMQEPCKSCARRDQDFGGCRCQAFLLTGDARAADPVCRLSPHHAVVEQLASVRDDHAYSYRSS